jgi:CubicO group peptidase (beta-lactamase class C family)
MMLAEKTGFDLERPVNDTSRIPLSDPEISERYSTLDVLSHRTGLPSNDLLWMLTPFQLDELTRRLQHLEMVTEAFRGQFIYSNLLYAALSGHFGNAAGETWSDFTARELIGPLEMDNTLFSREAAAARSDFAVPSIGQTELQPRDAAPVLCAGGMFSSAEDMGQWLQCQLRGGSAPDRRRLLSTESHGFMLEPTVSINLPVPFLFEGLDWAVAEEASYGLGWFIGRARGKRVVFHPGFIDGYSSALAFVPDADLGVAVLTNQNFTGIPGQLIHAILSELVRGAEGAGGHDGAPGSARAAGSSGAAGAGGPTPAGPNAGEAKEQTSEPAQQSPEPPAPRPAPEGLSPGRYEDPAYGPLYLAEDQTHTTDTGQWSLQYFNHIWPLTWHSPSHFAFTVKAMGLNLPLQGQIHEQDIYIPLSLDPRVSPRFFRRVPEDHL